MCRNKDQGILETHPDCTESVRIWYLHLWYITRGAGSKVYGEDEG